MYVCTEGCKSRYTVLLCITLITVYLLFHPSVCVVLINDTALELSFSSFLYFVSSHAVGTLTCDWSAQENEETCEAHT